MLNDFINALALTNEKYWFYLDTETMTIVKNRSTVDGMDVMYLAHVYPERFLPLPNKKQIHTYAIMEEYVASTPRLKGKAREKLRIALDGAGPFKRFKDEAKRQGLEEDWLRYRDSRFEQIARDWCGEHHVTLPVTSEVAHHTGNVENIRKPEQIIADIAAVTPNTGGMAIALIESIRLLFHMLDDESFERALNDLKKAVAQGNEKEK